MVDVIEWSVARSYHQDRSSGPCGRCGIIGGQVAFLAEGFEEG